MIRIFLLVSLFSWLSWSCESATPTGPDDPTPNASATGVFLVNEGNFSGNNASLSFLNSESNIISNNVFRTANNADLGDTGNSLVINDTLCFIVINNSHKIEVISTNTFKRVATIPIANNASPRHMVLQDVSRAYVSNLLANTISVIDLTTYRELTTIAVGNNPEELFFRGSTVYVTNSGFGFGNTVSVVSLSTSRVTDSLFVGDSPEWIRAADDGRLHVLCRGSFNDFNDPNDDTPGGVWVIDTNGNTVVDSLVLTPGIHPTALTIGDNSRGYFLTGTGIVQYDTDNLTMINDNFISGNFYNLQYDSTSNRIYATDAKDFQGPGELVIFDDAANEITRHSAGVIPGYIGFIAPEE